MQSLFLHEKLTVSLIKTREEMRESLNNGDKNSCRGNGMVEKRTNDTGKEQKMRRQHERNLLKIAQINQKGVA